MVHELKLSNDTVITYKIHRDETNDDVQQQIEVDNCFLVIVDMRDCSDEFVEDCRGNSNFEEGNFLVSEYVGSESSSENWYPDVNPDGLTDSEIQEIVKLLDEMYE